MFESVRNMPLLTPLVSGTHLIDLRMMKRRVDHGTVPAVQVHYLSTLIKFGLIRERDEFCSLKECYFSNNHFRNTKRQANHMNQSANQFPPIASFYVCIYYQV